MKKIIAAMIACWALTGATHAHTRNPYYHGHHHGHYGWVAPFVIGSAVTYAITRPQPQPVPAQPPVVYYPNMTPPVNYRYEQILDANCNCYRLVLVPNY